MSDYLKAKSSIESEDFRMASHKEKVGDSSTLEKMYPDVSEECVLCQEEEEDCKHLFFQSPFAHTIWASQGIALAGAIYETNF